MQSPINCSRFLVPRMLITLGLCWTVTAPAQSVAEAETRLAEAAELIDALTDAGPESIPTELLERARAIAVVPKVFRGGFILGARRGRGVLSLRLPDGSWSNPGFVSLTGGSIGWQIGAESTDIVLIFANDNAVKNIASGKFTLGGEATAVAGPLRKQASSTMTFRAEVYGYLRSRGLYAGAAFQGAKLDVDDELAATFYGPGGAEALAAVSSRTPRAALRFLGVLDQRTRASGYVQAGPGTGQPSEGAQTFPLPD